MEPTQSASVLYRTVWDGTSCAAMALEVFGIGMLIAVGTIGVIIGIAWLYVRRLPPERRSNVVRMLMLVNVGTGAFILAVIAFASFSGPALQRVDVASSGLTFSFCEGTSRSIVEVASRDVLRYGYRQRIPTGRRPRGTVDELVVTVRGRDEPLVVPLSTDGTVLDHALLARIVPRSALAPWISSLRERGLAVPAALAS